MQKELQMKIFLRMVNLILCWYFNNIWTHSIRVEPSWEIWEEWYQVIISFTDYIFLPWFIDSTESLCCGWCTFFSFIPSSKWVPGESLDRCFLVFHNNYLWALMFSGLGPSSFSSSRKEFRMISSCKMKYKSNLPFILCVVLADCIGPAVFLHAVARRNETLPQLRF